ncbi:MAG: phytoene desaturase family protein [Methylobacter sp.]|nr:phytoene desaturase family protein [Methylobacter sp.]MDP2430119.1 phytoene desaturase family protein [Methylobacter sp.]MDP3054260.1 phytoene desaturase family protein [Methylobacter sp.]MDP3363722.1 phytoene desaturase family protein [Methylobacter sp.]MDZ4220810.1 phytoene desaturase family protein [Methylobacter sp.]
MNNNNKPHVVVIGAGLGGLSAAISLATEGFSVDLLEKNDKVGGKLNVLEKDGFTFDLGPSILTMPHIFRALFERAGKNMDDYVSIESVEPHWRNFFEDGSTLDLSSDPARMKQQLDQLGPNTANEFAQFLAYSKKLCEVTEAGYFAKGLDSFWELLRHYGPVKSLQDFDVFRSMDQGVRRFIKDPKLVEVLNYFIKYVGSSPYDAPALMNLLPYIQFGYGLWYIKGGMYGMAQGLEKLALELGVTIRVNTEVAEIQHQGGRATAVRLADDSVIAAELIVSNMELIPAYQTLLHGQDKEIRRIEKFAPSCSGLVLHLGVDKIYPQLAHHNFFYSDHPREHFKAIFHDHRLSEDPTIYLVAPCKSDPQQAPAGCEIIKILPHIPHLDPENPLQPEDYAAMRERVLLKLERMGLTDLRKHIVCEESWTPVDIQQKYYSNQGAIYGVVADRFKNLGFKNAQRSKVLSNLYFVGGSVNPGGGMPMVTLSGQLVRDKILADLG